MISCVADPIRAASIIVTLLLAVILLKEKLEYYQKIGVVPVIAGIMLVPL